MRNNAAMKIQRPRWNRGALLLVIGIAVAAAAQLSQAREYETPENIILFIGDGMGVAHVTAAKIVRGSLHIERLRTGGFVMTHAGNELITDSAAGGTAMATGHKTYNGAISVSPGGEPLKTVLEYAEEAGKSTGLVVTCSITHATPAVFAAHAINWNMHCEIAAQMASSGVDVLIGGGWAYFIPREIEGSKREDGRNLLDELRARMDVALSVEEFRALGDVERLAAFFAPRHPPAVGERAVSLAELTAKAIHTLERDVDGFFLMVEGSQIDWAGHDNDSDGILTEMIDFDEAIGVGMDFAERDGGTLVIVTADHETGGFAVHAGSLADSTVTETTGGHTAEMVPLFAYGPGAAALGGVLDNTDIGRIMIDYMSHR